MANTRDIYVSVGVWHKTIPCKLVRLYSVYGPDRISNHITHNHMTPAALARSISHYLKNGHALTYIIIDRGNGYHTLRTYTYTHTN